MRQILDARHYQSAFQAVMNSGNNEPPDWAAEAVMPVANRLYEQELAAKAAKLALESVLGADDGADDGGTADPDHGEGPGQQGT